ncbi:uncharacterized protein M6B38_106715 [Iris pallida]|uniref:Uncharacterized protein n=1 Tax=Iris pallida TaxID=29817 RepID=A0AAX6EST7_IRIPA|nr:uncharacterized protein M6B38_106715 [Iris pallida]
MSVVLASPSPTLVPPPLYSHNRPLVLTPKNRRYRNFPRSLHATIKNTVSPLLPMAAASSTAATEEEVKGTADEVIPPMKLLFVEMGVGYDQHGQDITSAAMRACRDAITSNSIPAFRGGSIPGVTTDHMKLQITLGVPRSTQQFLDIERVKSVFPYGQIIKFEVVDGGMICSSGVCLEAMGDKNDDCYVVNAAVYVGY